MSISKCPSRAVDRTQGGRDTFLVGIEKVWVVLCEKVRTIRRDLRDSGH